MAKEREELIDLIVGRAVSDKTGIQKEASTLKNKILPKQSHLIKQASVAITTMAGQLKDSMLMCEKLAEENQTLAMEKTALEKVIAKRAREDAAEELAKEMFGKKLISKKEVLAKQEELCEMEKEAFDSLSDIVHRLDKADVKNYGADSLQWLLSNDNIEKEPTMLDAFSSLNI